jgi:acyl-CoA reductase-like NAD-dependent aldehyde dehydrogenase
LTTTSKTRHGINPATGEVLPEVPVCTKEDVDAAVSAARTAFKSWSKKTFEERRAALHAFSDALDAQKEDFADMLVREQGKPLDQALQEIGMAVMWLKELSLLELPETVLLEDEQRKVVRRHVPLGVACGIVPWNYPILLACGKIAPAIYTGNAMIIKPSPFTPYCDLKLGELAQQFFPPGVFSVLSGEDDLGPMLTDHDGIDKISFTGSSLTGKRIMASCARTLKRVTLELGGNDAAIICEDVDIEKIIPPVRNSRPIRAWEIMLTRQDFDSLLPMLRTDLHDD